MHFACQASKPVFRSHCARPKGRYILCERGVLSKFRAARARASYWFDKCERLGALSECPAARARASYWFDSCSAFTGWARLPGYPRLYCVESSRAARQGLPCAHGPSRAASSNEGTTSWIRQGLPCAQQIG